MPVWHCSIALTSRNTTTTHVFNPIPSVHPIIRLHVQDLLQGVQVIGEIPSLSCSSHISSRWIVNVGPKIRLQYPLPIANDFFVFSVVPIPSFGYIIFPVPAPLSGLFITCRGIAMATWGIELGYAPALRGAIVGFGGVVLILSPRHYFYYVYPYHFQPIRTDLIPSIDIM